MVTQCSVLGRSLPLLDKPPGLASICCVLQSPFIFGLYSTDPASTALGAGSSQGLVLDPSLKLLSVVASLSLALSRQLHALSWPLCALARKPIFLWLRDPPRRVLPRCSQSQRFPSSHTPPLSPVTGLLHRLLSPLEWFSAPSSPSPAQLVPLHPSVLGSDFLGAHLPPSQAVRSQDS